MKLKPCPFCRSTYTEILRKVSIVNNNVEIVYHAECGECGARGPRKPARHLAVVCWNRVTNRDDFDDYGS